MAAIAPSLKHETMGQPVEGGKDIIAVGFRECRFPIGERDGVTMFCASKCSHNETYCDTHYDKMYQQRKGIPQGGRPFIMPK